MEEERKEPRRRLRRKVSWDVAENNAVDTPLSWQAQQPQDQEKKHKDSTIQKFITDQQNLIRRMTEDQDQIANEVINKAASQVAVMQNFKDEVDQEVKGIQARIEALKRKLARQVHSQIGNPDGLLRQDLSSYIGFIDAQLGRTPLMQFLDKDIAYWEESLRSVKRQKGDLIAEVKKTMEQAKTKLSSLHSFSTVTNQSPCLQLLSKKKCFFAQHAQNLQQTFEWPRQEDLLDCLGPKAVKLQSFCVQMPQAPVLMPGYRQGYSGISQLTLSDGASSSAQDREPFLQCLQSKIVLPRGQKVAKVGVAVSLHGAHCITALYFYARDGQEITSHCIGLLCKDDPYTRYEEQEIDEADHLVGFYLLGQMKAIGMIVARLHTPM